MAANLLVQGIQHGRSAKGMRMTLQRGKTKQWTISWYDMAPANELFFHLNLRFVSVKSNNSMGPGHAGEPSSIKALFLG